jgi:hypothetical protein
MNTSNQSSNDKQFIVGALEATILISSSFYSYLGVSRSVSRSLRLSSGASSSLLQSTRAVAG